MLFTEYLIFKVNSFQKSGFLPETRQGFLTCFGLLLITQGKTGIKSKTHSHIPYKSRLWKCAWLKQKRSIFIWGRESRLWRRAPLGNYQLPTLPDNQTEFQVCKAKRSFPLAAPPSTLVNKHLIFPKGKRTSWGAFSFWSRWRESNSPGTAWEAAAIPLGDTCVSNCSLIIAPFL